MGGAIVAEVDEHLGGAAVGVFEGIGDGTPGIGENPAVVGYVLVTPGGGDRSVGGEWQRGTSSALPGERCSRGARVDVLLCLAAA